jgi:hypothetical protein
MAFSVDLLPRERIADMLRDRCSGVSQSIKNEYKGYAYLCGPTWLPLAKVRSPRAGRVQLVDGRLVQVQLHCPEQIL